LPAAICLNKTCKQQDKELLVLMVSIFTGEFTGIFQNLLPTILAAYPSFISVCRKLLVFKKRPE
jgi:hypothetical protein